MRIRRERRRLGILSVLIALASAVTLHAEVASKYTMGARVVSVAADKSTAVINKGKAEHIIPGSPVVIRPNRGDNEADIEWDIPFAKGVVQSVGKDTSVVKLTDVWQDIQARDYCEVDAEIPVAIQESDLGRIVLFDVTLTDYANRAPLFTLADLLRDLSSKATDAIITKLLGEIRTTNSAVFDEKFKTDRIKEGLYKGLTLREAFQAATRDHVEKFIEYIAWFAGRLVGYDWLLLDLYANWAYGGTLSGELAKKAHLAEPAVKSGDALANKGQFVESLAEYNRAVLTDPENAGAKRKIETVNRILERLRILQEDDKDVPTRRGLGLDLFELLLYARAADELQKARDLGDDSLEVRRYLGYAHAALSHFQEARALLEPLAAELPDDVGIRRWLDFVLQNEILAKQGPNVGAYMAVGEIKYKSGSYDDAIAEFNKALELAPRDASIWKRIGQTAIRRKAGQEEIWAKDLWQRGEFEGARSHWQTALDDCRRISDRDGLKAILREMGSMMYVASSYAEAFESYTTVLSIDPDDVAAHIEIARCRKALKDYAGAVEWAERGLAKDPKNAWGFDVLGAIHDDAGRIDLAIANYQKAVDIDPSYKQPLYNLGRLHALKGDYIKARDFFRKALEIDSDYGDARNRLMEIDAILEVQALPKTSPNAGESPLRLARALFGLGDYGRAIAVLKDALKAPGAAAWANEQLGYCLARQEKYAEGKAALEESYRLQPKPDIQAWIRYIEAELLAAKQSDDPAAAFKLGEDSLYWQSYDDALANFGRARDFGADPDAVAAAMELARKGKEAKKQLDLAADHYGRGQYEQALACAQRSLELSRELKARRGEIDALYWTGWSSAAMFRHEEALRAYTEAGRISEGLGDDAVTAQYFSLLGEYYGGRGEYEKAMEYAERAGALWHKRNAFLDEAGRVWPVVGWLKTRLGDIAGGLAIYERTLAVHKKLVNPKGEASALLSLAGVYDTQGDFSRAIDAYGKALAIARTKSIKETVISAYRGLGSVYSDLGDVENASRFIQNYLDAAQAQGLKAERANAMNNFGLLYLETVKDYDRAVSFFQESQSLAHLVGYRLLELVASENIAVVHSRQGNYREALARHEEALQAIRDFKDKNLEMQGLNEMGETHLGLKEYDQAIDCQLKAREIAEFLGALSEQWRYELAAGKAYQAKGDLPKAVEAYQKAVETLRGVKSRIANEKLLKGFTEQEQSTDVYRRLVDLLMKSGRTEEAFSYIEESKSKIVKDAFAGVKPAAVDENLKQTLLGVDQTEARRDALKEEIREERKKPEEARDPLKLETLTKTLAQTEGEFNQWMMKLKFQNRKMYDALSIKPATLGDVQRQVPPGAVFLEYFISPEELYVFCIGREFFLARSTVIAETELNTLVSRFVRACQEPPSGGPDDRLLGQARRLYGVLIAPVKDVVAKYETVVIVPFGPLYYLPFHALVTDESGKPEYLVERKRICYTTSATFADILKDQVRGHKSFMGFGNPDGSLPAASAELQGLQDKIFKSGAKVFTSGKATKEAFFAQAKNADILHLATHGVIEANPLESYLLFAGATKETQELTLLEVAGYTALRERNSLVFLSACQTAKEASKAGSGSELITLAEAFAMAGAPTLIATLWEVEDNATRLFSETFYDQLANKNKDKLDAMRAGQIALIRSTEYAHPFYWAAFLMIGSWH
jgi:tetratricopeptide (TPR) repeat protein